MANSIGTAWIQIRPSMKGIASEVSKELSGQVEKTAQKTSSNVKNIFFGMVGTVKKSFLAIGTAAAGFVATSVKNFAEFEQLSGGMQKIFGEKMWGTIEKDASAGWRNMNISANDYMKNITGIGSTFSKSLGQKKGYETAKMGMQSIADYASGTGKSVDLLMEKYQMISRNASTYLSIADQFAGILPQSTESFLQEAQAAGFLSDKYEKLSDVPVAEYQEALTKMIQKGVGDMNLLGNTAAETDNTLSGSFNGMKSSWENFTTALGSGDNEKIKKATDDLALSVGNFGSNVLPVVAETVKSFFKVMWENHPVLTSIAIALGVLGGAVLAINTAMTIWNGIVKVATAIQAIWNAVIAANPLALFLIALTAVIAGLTWFFTCTEQGKAIFQGMVKAIGDGIGAVANFFSGLWNKIVELFGGVGNWFKEKFQAAVDGIKGVFGGIAGFFRGIWDGVVKIFKDVGTKVGNAIGGTFKGIINTVIGTAEGIINSPINAINTLIDIINKVPGINLGKLPRVSFGRMARGGAISGAGTGKTDSIPIMASNGEYIIRAASARAIGQDALNFMNKNGAIPATAGAQNITININGYEKDPRALAREISQILALDRQRLLV